MAPPALRHRLILNFEGEAAGASVDDIIRDVLKHVPEPAA
jgi:MoxR-like ATPase